MENTYDVIALGAFFLVFILGIIFLVKKRKTAKQKFARRAESQGWVTEGVSENLKFQVWDSPDETLDQSTSTTTVTYRYQVGGETYFLKRKFYSSDSHGATTPHTVKVYYDPENPKKAVTNTEIGKGATLPLGCLLSFVLAFLAFHGIRYLFHLLGLT